MLNGNNGRQKKSCNGIKCSEGAPCKISGRIILFLSIILFIVLADQASKHIAVLRFGQNPSAYGPAGVISMTIVKNTGAAFGIFREVPLIRNVFVILSLIALSAVFYFRKHIFEGPFYFISGIALFAGGTLGNMLDRVFRGYVIDFIDIDIPDININILDISLERWPAFNVADSCICAGTFLILVYLWKYEPGKLYPKGR
ncbi:MAG: signal peptidase II [bacterium]|nr:signal peptidase II [bacterium]